MTKSSKKHSRNTPSGGKTAGQRLKKHARNLGMGVLPLQALGAGGMYGLGEDPLTGLSAGTLASMYTGDQAYSEAVRDTVLPMRTLTALAGSGPDLYRVIREMGSDPYRQKKESDPLRVVLGGTSILAGVAGDVKDYVRNYGDWSEQRRRRRRVTFGRKPARKVRGRKAKGKGKPRRR